MGTTNVTYGVDADMIESYLPQYSLGGVSTDVVTTARLANIVGYCAARVNGVLLRAGMAPADIAADTDSAAYLNLQGLVVQLAIPRVLRALVGAGTGDMSAVLEGLEEQASNALTAFVRDPASIGWDEDTDITPQAVTTVGVLGLDTSTAGRRKQRLWDSDSYSGTNKVEW